MTTQTLQLSFDYISDIKLCSSSQRVVSRLAMRFFIVMVSGCYPLSICESKNTTILARGGTPQTLKIEKFVNTN